ncbi:MAG: CPBP family intramembrane glutamic endopeptidase [Bacteroidota bacterium]
MKQVYFGFGLAIIYWFLMFSPWTAPHLNFWIIMMLATGSLITLSLVAGRRENREIYIFHPKYLVIGVVSSLLLYLIFWIGNEVSLMLFDFTERQVANVYSTKDQADQMLIMLALFFWIAPAEEIFWRGFAQFRMQGKTTPFRAWLITTAVYALVHIWAFNFMLFMAALIVGLFWGWIFYRWQNVWPALISHAIWDVLIFIIIPMQ